MKMNGNIRPFLSERLPVRKPNPDLWLDIANELKHSTTPLSGKLPVHQPDVKLWGTISGKLPAAPKKKYILVKFTIALLLLVLVFFSWMYFPEDQYWLNNFSDNAEKTEVSVNPDISGSTLQYPNQLTGEEISSIDTTASQHLTTENIITPTKTTPSIISTDQKDFNQHLTEETELKMAFEEQYKNDDKMPSLTNQGLEISRLTALNVIFPNNNPSINPQKLTPLARSNYSGYPSTKCLVWEIGGSMQASWIQNISTINNNWYFKPEAGISLGVRSKNFLFETGVSYCRFSFDDRIEVEYFKAVFLGTLITADKWVLEEYIDENGIPQTRKNYIVELVDIYDTTFVEQVKDDRVLLSIATVPLTFGYRLIDNGEIFYDLKTGIDLMIINGEVVPGNWQTPTMAERLEFHHGFVGNYSLKWKYHLALGIGYRMNERMSVFAAPSVWWSPDKIQQKENDTFKNPFEAGLRMGVKWEL